MEFKQAYGFCWFESKWVLGLVLNPIIWAFWEGWESQPFLEAFWILGSEKRGKRRSDIQKGVSCDPAWCSNIRNHVWCCTFKYLRTYVLDLKKVLYDFKTVLLSRFGQNWKSWVAKSWSSSWTADIQYIANAALFLSRAKTGMLYMFTFAFSQGFENTSAASLWQILRRSSGRFSSTIKINSPIQSFWADGDPSENSLVEKMSVSTVKSSCPFDFALNAVLNEYTDWKFWYLTGRRGEFKECAAFLDRPWPAVIQSSSKIRILLPWCSYSRIDSANWTCLTGSVKKSQVHNNFTEI